MCFVDLEKALNSFHQGVLSQDCFACSKSDLFPVHVGLMLELSLVLLIIFMDNIFMHSLGQKGVRFGDHVIAFLLFEDDVIMLASSTWDLQCALGRFAAQREVVGMRITSKSEAIVLDWKKWTALSGLVKSPSLKWRVLFTSVGQMVQEINGGSVQRLQYCVCVFLFNLSW